MSPAYKKSLGQKILVGIAASPGIAIGPAVFLGGTSVRVEERLLRPEDVAEEIKKFKEALAKTKEELLEIRKRARANVGEKNAEVFDAHLMILEDPIILEETIRRIQKEMKNADWIYFQIMRGFHDSLTAGKDEYLRERALDILDVKRRVIRNYQGKESCSKVLLKEPGILVGPQLTPSQIVLLNRRLILGLAIDQGGKTSHVSILARSFEKPAVVGLKVLSNHVRNGDTVIVDGNSGRVILRPTERTLTRYRQRQEQYQRFLKELLPLKDLTPTTLDGHEIELSANIEFPEEVESVLSHGARGVGLYRTEYLYLKRNSFPSEEEQIAEYQSVAEKLYPQTVILRTFDLGGDRLLFEGDEHKENNPFLGWRSIRICLDLPEIFKVQLRAILRASKKGNVKIMFPMVTSIEEIRRAKALLEEAKAELREEKLPFDENIHVGIMIEVPAAAMMAREFAREVNFLSIGTNDLVQYTLAVDRGNEKIAKMYTAFHPAVLRLIRETVEGGHAAGVWVGMCGEMASDPLAIPLLVGLGLDELSVTLPFLSEVKRVIRSIRFSEAQKLAQRALTYESAAKIQKYIRRFLRSRLKSEYRRSSQSE